MELDPQGHTTRMVTHDLLDDHDLILRMELRQKEALSTELPESQPRLHLLTESLEGALSHIPDTELTPGEHERVLREMLDVVGHFFRRITELAESRAGGGL